MAKPSHKGVTDLLIDWGKGDQEAFKMLMPLVYDELHRLAGRYLRHERQGHTLQTTALVHEGYLKLVNQTNTSLPDLRAQEIRRGDCPRKTRHRTRSFVHPD